MRTRLPRLAKQRSHSHKTARSLGEARNQITATCKPCTATSSICRDRSSGRTVCLVPPDALRTCYERWRCRIEPYWIKAVALRAAARRHPPPSSALEGPPGAGAASGPGASRIRPASIHSQPEYSCLPCAGCPSGDRRARDSYMECIDVIGPLADDGPQGLVGT